MRVGRLLPSILLLGGLCAVPAVAESFRVAQAGGVKGQDVMEDKGKSNADGFVWAPLSRDKGSGADAPGENNPNKGVDSEKRPGPVTGKNLSPGEDPGTPAEPQSMKAGASAPSTTK